MQPTRWDLVLDLKPKPILEHLLEEVSKLFAKDLAAWPPEVETFDAPTAATLKAAVEERPHGLDPRLYGEAFKLARWDLSRELDAYDDYVRHHRWVDAGLPVSEKALLLFLSRFMVEQLLGLNEATDGRVNRALMVDVLGRTERRFFRKDPS